MLVRRRLSLLVVVVVVVPAEDRRQANESQMHVLLPQLGSYSLDSINISFKKVWMACSHIISVSCTSFANGINEATSSLTLSECMPSQSPSPKLWTMSVWALTDTMCPR